MTVRGALIQMGAHKIDRARWDWDEVERNPFFCPDAQGGEVLRGLSRRHPQARLLGRRGDRGGGRGRARRARRAGLRQARRRSRRGADGHQRGQGRRDRRRLCARPRSPARRTPTRCAWATTASRVFLSNHAGGILGGISTGQPIVARFAVKPTSSILTPRRTVDRYGNETEIVTKGRHDPCVGIRAVPIGEAMVACVIADHYLRQRGQVGESAGLAVRETARAEEGITCIDDPSARRSRRSPPSPRGEIVVVTDDDDRENEGDLFVAASLCTPEKMAFIIRNTSGIVCAPLSADEAQAAASRSDGGAQRRAARHRLHRLGRRAPRADHRHLGRGAHQHRARARQRQQRRRRFRAARPRLSAGRARTAAC